MTKARDLATSGPSTGLVHIKTQTFSGVTSVDFENVFSATYTNYRIVMQGEGPAGGSLTVRLLNGSTPATGANYDSSRLSVISTSTTVDTPTGATSGSIGAINNTANNLFILEIVNPFGANHTMMQGFTAVTSSTISQRMRAVNHTLATSYDGIQIISSGTNDLTGTARVYGYKD